jgi:hypothetical protein
VLAGCTADTGELDPTDGLDASLPDADSMTIDVGADVGIDARVDAGPEGSGIGEPCAEPSDCRSADSPYAELFPTSCIVTAVNGWPGGYCTDFCELPDDPFAPPALVRSNCPEGAVCLPRSQGPNPEPDEEIGACFDECASDADCRVDDGYYCRRTFWRPSGEITFSNGYCAPNHCQSRGCPFSFVCGC